MRIVNRKTFLDLPAGVLYAKYQPANFTEFGIKGETICDGDEGIDFWYSSIQNALVYDGDLDWITRLEAAQLEGASLEMDFDPSERDACFETDQYFAIWEKKDREQLLAVVQKAISVST